MLAYGLQRIRWVTSLELVCGLMGILAALVLDKAVFRGKPVPFVMELPNYRFPSAKSVALLLWEKAKDFLQRAFTIIFLATIIIWFLQTFDTRLNVVTDSAESLLAMVLPSLNIWAVHSSSQMPAFRV